MKLVLRPLPLLSAAIFIAGGLLGNLAMLVSGLILFTAAVGFESMRVSRLERQSQATIEELKPDSRLLLKPILRIAGEIRQLAEGGAASEAAMLIAPEALAEAERVLAKSIEALKVRERLQKLLWTKHEAERKAESLADRVAESTEDGERDALEMARGSRSEELRHYGSIESGIKQIESGLLQAEAALAELRARLASATASAVQGPEQQSDLRETLGRVRALSMSVEEAEDLLRQ